MGAGGNVLTMPCCKEASLTVTSPNHACSFVVNFPRNHPLISSACCLLSSFGYSHRSPLRTSSLSSSSSSIIDSYACFALVAYLPTASARLLSRRGEGSPLDPP